jgi:uncharacterized membrane protein (UPF0182 family)
VAAGPSAAPGAGAPGEGAPAAATPAGGAAPAHPLPTGIAQLATEAEATYQRAIAAQKAGDWAKYGEEIKRLGEILAKMRTP